MADERTPPSYQLYRAEDGTLVEEVTGEGGTFNFAPEIMDRFLEGLSDVVGRITTNTDAALKKAAENAKHL